MGSYLSKTSTNSSGGGSGSGNASELRTSQVLSSSTPSSTGRHSKRSRRSTLAVTDDDDDENSSTSSSSDNESIVDELQTSINLILNYSQTSTPGSSSNEKLIKTFSTKRALNIKQQPKSIRPELVKPSRKKMKSTSNYIYNALFVNGENSDICVRALNREWHLHKLYLCQSPYFESMFKVYF